ncbi:MAG: VIT1/CCC1 transporter family protein [Actinomycetota bacterium]
MTDHPTHPGEEHTTSIGGRLNWLRASVLGANDGIVSTAGLVVGVAGATMERSVILIAGIAGLVAGALSMAVGEYISVSTQRDTEQALLAKERRELDELPDEELAELTEIYRGKGLSATLARQVAEELTAHDAFAAHVDAELHLDPDDLANPWQAAGASAVAFTAGALLPLVAIVFPGPTARVPITAIAVLAALGLTGWLSAHVGDANKRQAIIRTMCGGALAMAVTYSIGQAIGTVA